MTSLSTNLIGVPSQPKITAPVVLSDELTKPNVGEPFTIELADPVIAVGQEAYGDTTGSHAFAGYADLSDREKIETPEFPHLVGTPIFTLRERYKSFELKVINGTPKTTAGDDLIPKGALYLFNVIIALEWKPSWRMIDTLMHAFRSASDVLYDATNGGMAFGQVVFAGPDYLDRADVQILASNRFHPRSMVNGLTDPKKFSPIRLGRGIWRKDRHILLPWDENTGYRAITHEWAHYALGLHDEYIDDTLQVDARGNRLVEVSANGTPIVVPRVLVSLLTLMETLDADELVPLQNDLVRAQANPLPPKIQDLQNRVMNLIDSRYKGLEGKLLANNPGPGRFPVALPRFFQMPNMNINVQGEESDCKIDGITLDHCWLYSYSYQPGDDNRPALLRIISQGRIDDRTKLATIPLPLPSAEFKLLGAKNGDRLLAIGMKVPEQPTGTPRLQGTPTVQMADIAGNNWTQPPNERVWVPVVAVLPIKTGQDWPNMTVQVHVTGDISPTNVWLSLPGDGLVKPIYAAEHRTITHMDGIVALELIDASGSKRWVAEFSYGGNPPTTVRSPGAPLSAGSSDGNLMVFSALDDAIVDDDDRRMPFYNKPIVTTRNYAGFENAEFENVKGEKAQSGQPAGYLFSVASSEAIETGKQKPTIVMYYDSEALDGPGELVIHRYDTINHTWRALPTYLPSAGSYAATPIDSTTAPNLVQQDEPEQGRVEYYRLFSVPK